jgi:hypothetical protein
LDANDAVFDDHIDVFDPKAPPLSGGKFEYDVAVMHPFTLKLLIEKLPMRLLLDAKEID